MTSQDLQHRMMGTSESARLRLALVAAEHLERMGQRIRERREQLGLSRADVARAMPGKTNENAIYRWEKGRHRISDDTLEALARVLNVESAVYFMADGGPDGSTPDPFAGQEGAVEERLAELASQIAADRTDRDANIAEVKALIDTQAQAIREQAAALLEQATVLSQLRDTIRDLRETVSMQQDSARRLEQMTQDAIDAFPPRQARAPRKAPTGTSRGS